MLNNLYFQMLRIRRVEEALADAYKDQEIRTPMHLSIGQEAVAVGVCTTLKQTDKVYSGHRAHAHYIAKGGNLNSLFAELYGKATGCSNGRGGSMHLQDVSCGFMGSTAIVAGTIPLAVGSAFADKIKGNDNVTVIFMGDGAVEEGVFHESMNFAALHKLKIIFVCENNNLAVTTKLRDRQPNRPIFKIADAHGLQACCRSGNDVGLVHSVSKAVVERVRRYSEPQFVEFVTQRQRVHCGTEHEYVLTSDPLTSAELAVSSANVKRFEELIKLEISWAFKFAKDSPIPTSPERGVYAN